MKRFDVQACLRVLIGMVIMLAFAQFATIALSIAKISISGPIAIGILVAAVLAWALVVCRFKYERTTDIEPKIPASAKGVQWAIILAGAIFYCTLFVNAYKQPDTTCDGYAYHIPTIALWAQQGYIHWIDPAFGDCVKYMNGYPKGVELVSFLLVRAADNSAWINTANLIFLPLGVFGIAMIATLMGAGIVQAFACGMLYCLVPGNITQSPTTYVDSGFASAAIAFVALAMYLYSNLCARHKLSWLAMIACGLAAGLALSAKGTAIALVVIVNFTFLAIAIVLQRKYKVPQLWQQLVKITITCMLFAAALGGYWYLRNYYYEHSPIYPAGLTVYGCSIFPGKAVGQIINAAYNVPGCMETWPNMVKIGATWSQFPWNWPETIIAADSRFGGLGFFWVLGCIPCIVLAWAKSIRSRNLRQISFLAMLTGICVLLFAATPMNWWPRYTLWVFAIGLPCVAAIFFAGKFTKIKFALFLGLGILAFAEAIVCFAGQERFSVSSDPTICNAPNASAEKKCIPFAALSGTIFDQVFYSQKAVAVGPLLSQFDEQRWKSEMLGRLSLPVGARKLNALSADGRELTDAIKGNARWIVWDDDVPVPAALNAYKPTAVSVPGFIVFMMTK